MTSSLCFPSGFLWGAATSAHQTEGENRHSDWWRSEQQGRVPHRSGAACQSWTRWPEDLRLLGDLGLNAYRLSVEWARIEPAPGQIDLAVLAHYRRVLEALRAGGIEPVVTLHHFTNPLWLADRGGWTHPEVVPRFAAYADRVARELGDLVQWWVTINEPTTFGARGYLEGTWPPHRADNLRGYVRQQRHCVRAHAAARQALKAHRPDALASMAFALNPLGPLHRWDLASWAVARLQAWLREQRLLNRSAEHLDWVGVNYYGRLLLAWDPRPWRLFGRPAGDPRDPVRYEWERHARDLGGVLRRVARLGKPVLVTENGLADADDSRRGRFLIAHLQEAHQAIQAGVDLRGYFHWSLLDNFEWTDGYTLRFGLAAVDFGSPEKRRTLRPSASLYRDIARANAVPAQPPAQREAMT